MNFILPLSVKVLKKKNRVSSNKWTEFFNKACGVIQYENEENNKTKTVDGERLQYWYRVFEKDNNPTFLESSHLTAVKYGYCFVVLYKGYLLINSKYCSFSKTTIELVGQELSSTELQKLVVTDDADFQKVSLKNTLATSGIRNRAIDGEHLQSNFSPTYLGKNILTSYKVKQDDDVISQNLNSGRLNYLASKKRENEYLRWCKELIDIFEGTDGNSNYLQKFAIPLTDDEIGDLKPTSILISFSNLLESDVIIEEDGQEITKEDIIEFEDYYKINDKNGQFKIKKEGGTEFGTIVKNSHHLSLENSRLNNIVIKNGDTESNLGEYVSENSLVLFDDLSVSYLNGQYYKDKRFESPEHTPLFDILTPLEVLQDTTSEKGNFIDRQTSFDDDSMFGKVEEYLLGERYTNIICDDLNDEYGDFFAFDNNRISYYQIKHQDSDDRGKMGASPLQDVVGQAIKNLSFLADTTTIAESRRTKWLSKYKNSGIQTQIDRIRYLDEKAAEEEDKMGI